MFPLGLRFCLDLAILCFLWTPWFSGYMLSWFLRYMFHVSISLFPMFPSCTLCLLFHFLGLRSFPSTLPYCTSLTILRSHTHLLLRRIRSLVYILRVLVTVDLRTNITCLPSYLSEVPSERSETPARLWRSLVSSVLDLVLPGTRSGVDSQ